MKKKVLKVLRFLIYWFSYLIPTKKNLWVFGSWSGKTYTDNPKYFFEYVNKNHPNIDAVWISSDHKTVKKIKEMGWSAHHTASVQALYLTLRANLAFFAQKQSDIYFARTAKTELIQLWHGIPLKKIGLDAKQPKTHSKSTLFFRQLLFPYNLPEAYALIVASSEEDAKHFKTAFNNNNVEILGYPRNDIFHPVASSVDTKTKKIVYMPTLRGGHGNGIDLFTQYSFNLAQWSKYLEATNSTLYIKMHPFNLPNPKILNAFEACSHIVFLYDDIDIYAFLLDIDVLITDYSSIYFDFLLTEKPIIFTPFDIETYLNEERKLYYNYKDVTPGPHCYNWDDVLTTLQTPSVLERHHKQRVEIKNCFHTYSDGRNAVRLYHYLQHNFKT